MGIFRLRGAMRHWADPGVQLAGRGGDVFVGPYDDIPNIAALYALRRGLTAYTGPLIRLRRSSDNAEDDFGWLPNGDLEVAAIAAWLGEDDGYVTTWYDQSGNGRNAAQSTAVRQPLFVASGQNGRPVLRFDGIDDSFVLSGAGLSILRNVPGGSVLAAVRHSGTDGTQALLSVSISGNASSARLNVYVQATRRIVAGGRRLDTDSFQSITGGNDSYTDGAAWLHTSVVDYANSDAYLYKNGALLASSTSFQADGLTSDTDSASVVIGGGSAAGVWPGDIAELVIANAAWNNTQRQAAESAANSYWSVYA